MYKIFLSLLLNLLQQFTTHSSPDTECIYGSFAKIRPIY